MKKILIACMLAAFLAVPAFASNSNTDLGGITIGPAFKWYTYSVDDATAKRSFTDIVGYITETSYFGDNDNLGLSVGFGIDKTLVYSLNGTKQEQSKVDELPLNLSTYLYFQYKYDFSNTIALEAGIGPQFDMAYKETTRLGNTKKEYGYTWLISAKVNALIHFGSAFALQAGCYLGMPLSYQYKEYNSYSGVTSTSTQKISGFALTPFVGAMFSF